MTKVITLTYNITHEYRRQITLTLLAMCTILIMTYALNLYRVISHTISLQRINAQTNALDATVQNLDSQYLSISSKITPDILGAHGFNQGQVSAFISQTKPLGRVAMAGHEL